MMTDRTVVAIARARKFVEGHTANDLSGYAGMFDLARAFADALVEISRPSRPIVIRVEHGDWQRASGLVVCPSCQLAYFDHGVVPGYEWLRALCDGRLVKL